MSDLNDATSKNKTKKRKKSKNEDVSSAEKEWTRFGTLLDTEAATGIDTTKTLYDELMGKETRVLSTIDRYIEDKAASDLQSKRFINTPISQIPVTLFRTLGDLLTDASKAKTKKEVNQLFSPTRLIYLGILLIIIAVFILFM